MPTHIPYSRSCNDYLYLPTFVPPEGTHLLPFRRFLTAAQGPTIQIKKVQGLTERGVAAMKVTLAVNVPADPLTPNRRS